MEQSLVRKWSLCVKNRSLFVCFCLLQAARLQTEGVAVSSVLLSLLVGGSVVVYLATSSTKMASAVLPLVSHTMEKQTAKTDKPMQINTLLICLNLTVCIMPPQRHSVNYKVKCKLRGVYCTSTAIIKHCIFILQDHRLICLLPI